jgi:GT2 family glycosyltransferase
VAAAGGRTLLLLHADTRLPDGYARDVERVLGRPGVVAGAFGLRIDAPRRALRLVERAVDVRSRLGGMPYGDQALFLRARVLETVGGVPDLPAMEDYELVRRLRRRGRIAIARSCVTTSARRWQRRGILRTTALNQWCIIAYRVGVDPVRIARWRWNADTAFPNTIEDGGTLSPTGGSP